MDSGNNPMKTAFSSHRCVKGVLEWRARARLATIISLISCLLFFGSYERVEAAVFNVESGDVTGLIAAINAANANGEDNTINLEPGTYTLTAIDNGTGSDANGLPVITGVMTINGTDAANTIIEKGARNLRFRLFKVATSGRITIDGLTVRKFGLGIFGAEAGAFNNAGSLTIKRNILEEFVDAVVIHNSGIVKVSETLIRKVSNFHDATIVNLGTMTLMSSTITLSGADGPLITNDGVMTVQNSTISKSGDSIGNGGSLTIVNSTIQLNGLRSTGIANGGSLKINSSTIANNGVFSTVSLPPVGVSNGGTGSVDVQNSVLFGNNIVRGRRDPGASDCRGRITSLGNNIVGNVTDCDINLQPTDVVGDPSLGEYVDDGTPGGGRVPLLAGSRAIDAGSDSACLSTDQLGTPRRGACDIGAVEFYPIVNDLLGLANLSTAFDPAPVAGGPAGVFRVTAEFNNTSSQAIANPFAEVVELSGGNLLLNADGGAGGVGARLTLPNSAMTRFEPGATSSYEFLIGLQQQEPFTFFVNLLGVASAQPIASAK